MIYLLLVLAILTAFEVRYLRVLTDGLLNALHCLSTPCWRLQETWDLVKGQPCVLTDQGGCVLPGKALLPPLPGDASFRAASDGRPLLLGDDLARLGSGLAYVAPECLAARMTGDGADVGARTALVLERLGLVRFGAEHLVACLTHSAAGEVLAPKPARWLLDLYLGLAHLSETTRPAPELAVLWAQLLAKAPLFRVMRQQPSGAASGGGMMVTAAGAPAAASSKGARVVLWDPSSYSLDEDLPLFLPHCSGEAAVSAASLQFLDPDTHDVRVEAVLRGRFAVCRVTLLQLVARLMELHSDLLQRPQPEAAHCHKHLVSHLEFLFRRVLLGSSSMAFSFLCTGS